MSVGVFLVADDEVGGFHHGRGQVAVRIQLRADHRVRADDLARAAQQIAFAIVVAVGHHRAVQAEQRHVHGAGVAQVLQQFVAQRFIGVARGDAGRHGGGGQAFDQRPVLPLALARRPQRAGIHLHAVRMLAGRVAARAVGAQAGGDGEKVLVSVAREPEKIFMLPPMSSVCRVREAGARGNACGEIRSGRRPRPALRSPRPLPAPAAPPPWSASGSRPGNAGGRLR